VFLASPKTYRLSNELGDKPAVAVYDVDTFAMVGAVELGKYGAVELTFSSDGERVYFSQFETAAVYEIDRRKRKLLRKLETGSAESKIVALSPDDATLYVANWKGNDISEFDLASGEVRRVLPTAGIPRGLYPSRDGKNLYVAGYSPPRLLNFDLNSGERTTVASFGGAIRHIAADEAGGRLYFSDLGKFKIWQLDLGKGEVSEFADTNRKPNTIDLSPDKRILFVSNRGANNPETYLDVGPEWGSVLAFDTATGELVDAIIAGNQSTGLDVSPDGRLLAVSDFLDNRINIYEIPPSATLVDGGGGNGASHRALLTKKGGWGRKAKRDRKVFAGVEVVEPSP
jgi:DNA-binding beta-propeller fold protein YncE